MSAPVYNHTNSAQMFPFLYILVSICYHLSFCDGHSNWCKGIYHSNFDLHFPNSLWCLAFSCVPIGFLYIFFENIYSGSFSSVQFSSVAQSCPTLCDPMNRSTPGLPVHHRSSLRLTSIESVMPSSHLIFCHPLLLLSPIPPSIRVFSNESTLRMRWPNKQGDNIQPWHTPFPMWNQSIVPCPVLTVASWPAYKFLKRQVRWSGIPISFRIFHSLLWST